MITMPQGPAPLLMQPDNKMSLAALLAPRRPAAAAPLIDPAKIMSFMKMREAAPAAATPPGQGPDMSGDVVSPGTNFGKLVNGIAGSEGLLGSNGWVQRQFGAQPSAMNQYGGPAMNAAPISALSMPGADPSAIAPRWGG